MYKVLRSYTKKAERKHEVTTPGGVLIGEDIHRNGAVVPSDAGMQRSGAWAAGFSESSSLETHEHYERKVQRVKKTRSDRDRERMRRNKVLWQVRFLEKRKNIFN